jgi:plastocyanin
MHFNRSLAALMMACCWASLSAYAAPQTITVTNEAGQPLANAAVSVFVKGARATAPAGATADMAQKGRAFQPTLLVVQTGTPVLFPNFDTVRHHVYSFSSIKKFEIKLYAGTPAAPVVFDKAGTATLGCNIHDKMLGYIHVVDTPYFGVTGSDGQLSLDLPAGEHQVRVWWPALGEANPGIEQPLKATGTQPLSVRVKP